jgi:hypothetical protein
MERRIGPRLNSALDTRARGDLMPPEVKSFASTFSMSRGPRGGLELSGRRLERLRDIAVALDARQAFLSLFAKLGIADAAEFLLPIRKVLRALGRHVLGGQAGPGGGGLSARHFGAVAGVGRLQVAFLHPDQAAERVHRRVQLGAGLGHLGAGLSHLGSELFLARVGHRPRCRGQCQQHRRAEQ